jgi:hypothetical protein
MAEKGPKLCVQEIEALQHALRNPKHDTQLNLSDCIALHYVMGKSGNPNSLNISESGCFSVENSGCFFSQSEALGPDKA